MIKIVSTSTRYLIYPPLAATSNTGQKVAISYAIRRDHTESGITAWTFEGVLTTDDGVPRGNSSLSMRFLDPAEKARIVELIETDA